MKHNFLENLIKSDGQLINRSQKIGMIKELVDNHDKFNSPDFNFSVKGMATLCSYLFFNLGDLNS